MAINRPRLNQPTPPKPFDPRDPSTWGPSSQPTESVGKVGYVDPKTNVRPAWSNDPDYRSAIAGQTPIRPRTAQEQATRDAYDRYDESRRKRIIGDDIGAAPGIMQDVAFRHLVQYPAESLGRTLSGKNFANYADPRGGWRLGERGAALGEDALNAISIIPGMRAIAEGLALAPEAILRSIVNRQTGNMLKQEAIETAAREAAYNRMVARAPITPNGTKLPMPPKEVYVPKIETEPVVAPPTRATIARQKAADLSSDLELATLALEPDNAIMTESDLWKNDYIRALVEEERTKLNTLKAENVLPPVEDGRLRLFHTNPTGERLPEQLYPMDDAPTNIRRNDSGGMLLSNGLYTSDSSLMSGTYNSVPKFKSISRAESTGSYLPKSVQRYSRTTRPNYFVDPNKERFFSLDTPISETNLSPRLLDWEGNISQHGHLFGNQPSIWSYKPGEKLPHVNLSDTDITKWNFGGKPFDKITVHDLLNAAPNKEAAEAVLGALTKPVRVDSYARFNHPIITNPGGVPGNQAFASQEVPAYLFRQRGEPINVAMPSGEISPKHLTQYVDNGYNYGDISSTPFYNQDVWNSNINVKIPGGQNYWDLKAPRDVTGNISELNGMKAFDVQRATSQQRKELADATEEWLRGYGVTDKNELRALRLRFEHPGSGQELPNFRAAAWDMQEMISRAGHPNIGDVRGEWYNMLKEKLGIEAFPHPGGVTTGNIPHQSVVINSPEKLPPSNYITYDTEYNPNNVIEQVMNDILRQNAIYRRASTNPGFIRLPRGSNAADLINQAFNNYLYGQAVPRTNTQRR